MTTAQGAARKTLARRAVLLSAGLLPTAGMISGMSRAAAATEWANYTSPDSGASIRYPRSSRKRLCSLLKSSDATWMVANSLPAR